MPFATHPARDKARLRAAARSPARPPGWRLGDVGAKL